jgi:hypothetical protein
MNDERWQKMKYFYFSLTMVVLALLSGCQSLAPTWPTSWFGGEEKPEIQESKYPRPARMAVIWSPGMLNSPGKKPTRGFGGRVYFYDGQNKAVPAEGQLVVYGYNDSKPGGDSKTPDRKFAFTPEQFTAHFNPTELGASYSIWIPWDEIGNPQIDVSLVPIFTAASGQLVVGQASKVVLPGPETPTNQTTIERFVLPPPMFGPAIPGAAVQGGATQYVQQASYIDPQPGPAPQLPPQQIQETSIRLSGTLAERLANAPPQEIRERRENPAVAQTINPNPTVNAPAMPGPPAASQQMFLANRPRSARSEPPARPVPSSPSPQPTRGRLPTPPYPATPPFGPPSAPPASPQTASPAAW